MQTASEPREKILGLVAAGKISADEGQLLLGALKPGRRQLWKWLSSPFELATQAQVWSAAGVVCAASLALRPALLRFDGALDLHVGEVAASWGTALLDQAVAWPLTAFVFWLLALVTRQRARLVDLLGFVGAARAPYLLMALVLVAVRARARIEENPTAAVLVGLATLPLLIWMCWLLYAALRTATGSHGPKLTFTFFGGLLLAEVASKMILMALS